MIPSTTQNVPSQTRTIKQIIPVDKATDPYFAIQILALRDAPNDAAFFQNIESAREFSCEDGFKRYVVGRYDTKEEAVAELAKIRAKGVRYAKSYVVNTANFVISSSSFKSEYSDEIDGESIDKNDKLSRLRTSKKIIPVDKATEPPFAIQILALKSPPQDPNFFENVIAAREFNCQDGFARYVVGQYESHENASADLSRIRSLSVKYKSAFVVNTSNFNILPTAFSSEYNDGSGGNMDIVALRTSKRIIPVDKLEPQLYTVQVLALKDTPKDAAFFERLDLVREASCKDGFKRYLVGQFANAEDARNECETIRRMGPKYKNAFIISNQKIQLDATVYSAEYNDPSENKTPIVESKTNRIEKVETPIKTQNIVSNQNDRVVEANKEVVKTGGNIEYIDKRLPENTVVEQRNPIQTINKTPIVKDDITINTDDRKIKQISKDEYVVELPKKTSTINNTRVTETPNLIRTNSGEIAVKTDEKVLIDSRKTLKGDDEGRIKSNIDNTQLPSIRTNKKITPVDKVDKPYYTVQILALKDTPTDPQFFDNIETAKEFSCKDGYKRYVVGEYETYEEAKNEIERIKELSPKYKNAFVANTKNYDISLEDFRRDFGSTPTVVEGDAEENIKQTELNKIDKSSSVGVYDPNKVYTIQLTASRYPFYVSELKEFNEVYEFFMPDKVFRYTVGKYNGNQLAAEIKKVVAYGYVEAFPVEWQKYLPYKIE